MFDPKIKTPFMEEPKTPSSIFVDFPDEIPPLMDLVDNPDESQITPEDIMRVAYGKEYFWKKYEDKLFQTTIDKDLQDELIGVYCKHIVKKLKAVRDVTLVDIDEDVTIDNLVDELEQPVDDAITQLQNIKAILVELKKLKTDNIPFPISSVFRHL